jgi:hypothetical protein
VPIVLLHTDLSESGAKASPYELEKLMGREVAGSQWTRVMRLNPVAKVSARARAKRAQEKGERSERRRRASAKEGDRR